MPSLDEDRILRSLMRLIEATVRTNFYRPDRQSLRSPDPGCPTCPNRSLAEIFVLADHVRHPSGPGRARGRDPLVGAARDYRNEVSAGKAQVTKNGIALTGAKGGFVLRYRDSSPEAVQRAYETYIRGLLDVTDNLSAASRHPRG